MHALVIKEDILNSLYASLQPVIKEYIIENYKNSWKAIAMSVSQVRYDKEANLYHTLFHVLYDRDSIKLIKNVIPDHKVSAMMQSPFGRRSVTKYNASVAYIQKSDLVALDEDFISHIWSTVCETPELIDRLSRHCAMVVIAMVAQYQNVTITNLAETTWAMRSAVSETDDEEIVIDFSQNAQEPDVRQSADSSSFWAFMTPSPTPSKAKPRPTMPASSEVPILTDAELLHKNIRSTWGMQSKDKLDAMIDHIVGIPSSSCGMNDRRYIKHFFYAIYNRNVMSRLCDMLWSYEVAERKYPRILGIFFIVIGTNAMLFDLLSPVYSIFSSFFVAQSIPLMLVALCALLLNKFFFQCVDEIFLQCMPRVYGAGKKQYSKNTLDKIMHELIKCFKKVPYTAYLLRSYLIRMRYEPTVVQRASIVAHSLRQHEVVPYLVPVDNTLASQKNVHRPSFRN